MDELAKDILKIEMLGGDGSSLVWSLDEDGLHIDVPEVVPSAIAVSFKMTLKQGV